MCVAITIVISSTIMTENVIIAMLFPNAFLVACFSEHKLVEAGACNAPAVQPSYEMLHSVKNTSVSSKNKQYRMLSYILMDV